jgi:hypothetical protein
MLMVPDVCIFDERNQRVSSLRHVANLYFPGSHIIRLYIPKSLIIYFVILVTTYNFRIENVTTYVAIGHMIRFYLLLMTQTRHQAQHKIVY